ncbi:MAG: hypothetical protein HYX68_23180 [Planctomycetes bacterium]|nr:hypothetical protein [Planctomycetota bacterium]
MALIENWIVIRMMLLQILGVDYLNSATFQSGNVMNPGNVERVSLSTEGAQIIKPRASAAPPWVIRRTTDQALKGRHKRRPVLWRPFRAFRLPGAATQGGASLALGYMVCAPSVLHVKRLLTRGFFPPPN